MEIITVEDPTIDHKVLTNVEDHATDQVQIIAEDHKSDHRISTDPDQTATQDPDQTATQDPAQETETTTQVIGTAQAGTNNRISQRDAVY